MGERDVDTTYTFGIELPLIRPYIRINDIRKMRIVCKDWDTIVYTKFCNLRFKIRLKWDDKAESSEDEYD